MEASLHPRSDLYKDREVGQSKIYGLFNVLYPYIDLLFM